MHEIICQSAKKYCSCIANHIHTHVSHLSSNGAAADVGLHTRRMVCFPFSKLNHSQAYHSKTGVYGYRPHKRPSYRVSQDIIESRNKQSNFYRFVTAYKQHGHKTANINPVEIATKSVIPELDPSTYGLKATERYNFHGIISASFAEGTLEDAIQFLERTYCDTMAAEFYYLESEEEREWFAMRMEQLSSKELDHDTRRRLATEMIKSQAFDKFLGAKFVTLKRYSGEGAESMMPFFMEFFTSIVKDGVEHLVLCSPHRGRLNLLTGLLHFPPALMFRKIKGLSEFSDEAKATGDVLSHFSPSVDLDINGKSLHVTMVYNPSHLEAVNSVSMGKTRSRQQSVGEGDYLNTSRWSDKVLNLQVHGDAAFAGQGVNQESLAMSATPHFEIGGSVHLIVNNQVGFTTPGDKGRSSNYCSDLAKMISAPVLHVNADYPEMVVKATRLALEYQRKFRKEVFIDLNCFRQWGHNELDDPTFTNPALYSIIKSRRTIPDLYADSLVQDGIMTIQEVEEIASKHSTWLNDILKELDSYAVEKNYFKNEWSGMEQAPAAVTTWDTGADQQLLTYIGQKSVAYPAQFNIHPHLLKTHVNTRLRKLAAATDIDWATAEALAFGSLLYEGFNVRLSGQDVGRGTFSHRHVMLVDQETNDTYIPLNNMIQGQNGHLEVANSILSEEAVLGFEYGMSIENPNNLIIWEAQFGDFANGAQIMIDTFITAGETKWMTCSGLVMMLPHGYDGAGPEHSSSRLERYLQLSDSSETDPGGEHVNIRIANPTTAAQYFHLLRQQMIPNYRKPLIIISPKTLIRSSDATSPLSEMAPQTTFTAVLGDQSVNPEQVHRMIFVSGKHYYALVKQREELQKKDVAIIRVEGLSPFPTLQLQQEVARYKNAKLFIWSQEEPQNMGAWSFVRPRFENLIGRKLKYSGRDSLATPAVGIGQLHLQEAQLVISKPFIIK